MISAIFDRSLWDLWPNASKTGISAAFRADPIRFKIGVTWQNPHRILHSYWIKMLLRSVFPACKHLLMSWTLAFSNGCWGGCIGIFVLLRWLTETASQPRDARSCRVKVRCLSTLESCFKNRIQFPGIAINEACGMFGHYSGRGGSNAWIHGVWKHMNENILWGR